MEDRARQYVTTCRGCGGDIIATNPRRMYCTSACRDKEKGRKLSAARWERRKQIAPRACEACGAELPPPKRVSGGRIKKYCENGKCMYERRTAATVIAEDLKRLWNTQG